ncbi:MAG TPA: trypsin-like peptidase domain-containing protein [Candidatus Dormibacteraeota bacterium]|nr:trypsin-like peptidase domain-containing protein [Candidatus Dormibacteraeota bacterium]
MSEEWLPPPRPIFRSANPYSDLVDAEDAAAPAPPAGAPAEAAPPGWWPAEQARTPRWSFLPPGESAVEVSGTPAAAVPPPAPPAVRPAPPARPPAPRRPSTARLSTAVVAVTLVVAGAGTVGLGALLARVTSRSSPVPASLLSPAAGGSAAGALAASAAPTPAPPPPLTLAEIESRADPAVVDVTATLPSQGAIAEGTGMLLTPQGEVLTNDHVVDGASRITVLVGGRGRTYRARIVGTDRANDVAVLQLQGVTGRLPTIAIGDSSLVAIGDAVVVLGNAQGRQGKPVAATGTVTALDQTVTASDSRGANAETLKGLIQVDAHVEAGDSGGPLLDAQARVIGMDTAAAVRQRAGAAGYAIPIARAVDIAFQITGAAPSG